MPTVLAGAVLPGLTPQPFLGPPVLSPNIPPPIQLIDPTFQGLRTSIRPLDHASGVLGGHFRCSLITGAAVNIAAAAPMVSLLWTAQPNMLLVLERIRVCAVPNATVTTPNQIDLQAFIFRGATGAATGGSAKTLTGPNQKARGIMGASLVADLRVSTTAALGAAAGKTNDSNPFAIGVLATGTGTVGALGSSYLSWEMYKADIHGGHPIVLAPNEGIEIQPVTAVVNSGSMKYYFDLEWSEVSSY